MTHTKKHIEKEPELSREMQDIISGSHIAWDKSKEQIWHEMEGKLDNAQPDRTKVIYMQLKRLAVAAVLLILIGVPALMTLYTKTIETPSGQHAELLLPDNSKVVVNAQSSISYKPLMWKITRRVKFEGEAFFDIEKGKKFEVISGVGKTIVLGTSFNIYSRNNEYNVTCVTGKVKVVENNSNGQVILAPGEKARLKSDGKLEMQSGINFEQDMSWMKNRFSFTSVPLKRVFEEIGRQYGIKISISGQIDNIYTGTFNKNESIESVLGLVCRPFNLKYSRKSENEYIISSEN